MMSALSGTTDTEIPEHNFNLEKGDLALIVKAELDNILVYWPNDKYISGYDILKLYSILIRFELTLRDLLKEGSSFNEMDLNSFKNQIVNEALSIEDQFDKYFMTEEDKGKIH